MHGGVETQEIVEASAEHDFPDMRLNGTVRASRLLIRFILFVVPPSKKQVNFHISSSLYSAISASPHPKMWQSWFNV